MAAGQRGSSRGNTPIKPADTGTTTLTQHRRHPVSDAPQDPLTELAAGAVQLHELYIAQVEAGFTEQQAMQIVIAVLTASMGGGQ
jgi:hypothetical protein